jgi:Holliday junction resolvasome RuvABC endonuclease subunit
MILSLDPSTTALGWAIGEHGEVVAAGVIKPPAKDDWIKRLHVMSATLTNKLNTGGKPFPERVIIESPDGKIHARNRASGGQGASKYGFAVGMFYGAFAAHDVPVEAISVNEWTRGKPKERRAREIEIILTRIDFGKDPGLDAHDAAAMLQWWYDRNRFANATAFPQRMTK